MCELNNVCFHFQVVWNTCYKKFNQCAKDMPTDFREVMNYTLQWVDNWYFDGKPPDIPEEKVLVCRPRETVSALSLAVKFVIG